MAEKPFNHDAHLIREIKEALHRGTESAALDVQVSAEDGAVRLSGVVDVLSHKRAAEEIVRRIPGVRHIDNDIAVANEEPRSDQQLRHEVTEKLAAHPDFRGIGCEVHKGVVTLVGHAEHRTDIGEAVRLVEGMPGVREVRVERIKVGEGHREDDRDVRIEAERRLEGMGYDVTQFQVYCADGVLHVKGFVPTRADRSRIKTAMHEIPGVNRVESLLVTDDQLGDEIH
jgi:hyperosmotically inducible protein